MPRPRRVGRAAAAAVGLVAGILPVTATSHASEGTAHTEVTVHDRHLPTAVHAPGTWSDEQGIRGPVAAIGISTRTRPRGVLDDEQSLALFAVSALDGSATWLRLPGFSLDRWGFAGGFTVSPDGEWLGWVRPQRRALVGGAGGRLAGWAVMNTSTGRTRLLEDPRHPSLRGTVSDLEFSGDSRYLLTSYETPDLPREPRTHQFVAWDVQDGTRTVLEPPGHYWLPNLGTAPTGVTWARKRRVFRTDPTSAASTTTVTLPRDVITASWGPDDTSFAYVGRPSGKPRGPWRLYAGPDLDASRNRPIALPDDVHPSQLLGWRDATHVVVGHHRRTVHVVDVVTGSVEAVDLAGYGEQVNAPYLAGGLWQQPLIAPVEPDGTTDPRRPWRWASGGVLAAAAAVALVRRRRRTGGAASVDVRQEP